MTQIELFLYPDPINTFDSFYQDVCPMIGDMCFFFEIGRDGTEVLEVLSMTDEVFAVLSGARRQVPCFS